jgi:hypothetical protein
MLAKDFVISGYGVMSRIMYLLFQAMGLWDLNDLDKLIAVFINLISILMCNREQIVTSRSALSHAALIRGNCRCLNCIFFFPFRNM